MMFYVNPIQTRLLNRNLAPGYVLNSFAEGFPFTMNQQAHPTKAIPLPNLYNSLIMATLGYKSSGNEAMEPEKQCGDGGCVSEHAAVGV